MKQLADIVKFPSNLQHYPSDSRSSWDAFCDDYKIPDCYRNADFSQLRGLNEMVKENLKKWILGEIKNIIFFGGVGCGKTHTALALLKFMQKKRPWIQYLSSEKMLKLGEEKGVDFLRRIYGECEVLVIDDLGVERSAEWQTKYLYAIADERYNNKNPTIITTNFDEATLESMYTRRIFSRFQAEWTKFDNVDWREML